MKKAETSWTERQSAKYTEKYADYLELGVIEWRKASAEHEKLGKKAILFVMTDDTRNCDEVAEYLENRYSDLKDAVLVIHTKRNGEITEATTGKKKEELEKLRKQAKEIDSIESPYKALVSVLMLKEGWDVRNVTTIVGLRPYSAKSNILPEQTLGRGLRRMYLEDAEEYVSVVGTNAFMEFVESIQAEGVELERRPMGEGAKSNTPLVIEVDTENHNKNINALDIEIPTLTRRVYREYKNLEGLDLTQLDFTPVTYRGFSAEEQREIVFRDMTTGKETHRTAMDSAGIADYRSALGYFAQVIMKELKLVSGYDVLYGKVKEFIQNHLFGELVDLDSPNTIRNLAEPPATKTVIETLRRAINDLTIQDKGEAQISETIRLRDMRPFVVKEQPYLIPEKSVFNRITCDNQLERDFASFLDDSPDVVSFAKNYFALGFKLDYVNDDGDIANYYPDFFAKLADGRMIVAETKGRKDVDVDPKMYRLAQWCEDINAVQSDVVYDFVYVDEDNFREYTPRTFQQLLEAFTEYKV